MGQGTILKTLVGSLALAWVLLGIAPHDRADWLLENVLTVVAGLVLVANHRRHPLSTPSYVLLWVFAMLHTLGAHYTYSNVPYDRWAQAWLGMSVDGLLGWERNNFDRVIHFLWGLLLFKPLQEWMDRAARPAGAWRYWYPLEFIMASSMVYELIEWGAAAVFGGELGVAYLGTQGDVWDAQKDMALAMLGGMVAWGVVAWRARRPHATRHHASP